MADGNLKLGVDVEVGSDKELQQLLKRIESLEKQLSGGIEVDLDTSQAEKSLRTLADVATAAFTFEALGSAGDFLSGIAEDANAANQSFRNLAARTGASVEEMDRLRGAAEAAFSAGVGENLSEAVDAIATASNQLGDVFNADELAAFTTTAAGIAEVFDKDVNEVLQKSRTFVKNFGLDAEEAGGLLSVAMREGASGMDDVLDTLDEYSQLAVQAFGEGETAAAQFVGTLTTGVQAGLRDTDKLADAIKEAQIRLRAGDVTNALKDISSPITATIEGIVKAGEQGKISVAEVIRQTAEVTENAFDQGQISESIRTQLQVAIAGTPAEDLGSEMYGRIFAAPIDTAAISAKGDEARRSLEQAIGSTNVFEQLLRDAEGLGQSLAGVFAPAISGGASLLTTLSSVAPALTLLQANFGGVAKSALEFGKGILEKIVPGLFAQTTATGAATAATVGQTAATTGATVATRLLSLAMAALPWVAVAAGAALLVGALISIFSGGESVEEALEGVNAELENTQKVLSDTAELDKTADNLLKLADTYDRLESSEAVEDQAEFAAASRELGAAVPEAVVAMDSLKESADNAGGALKINTDIVRSFAESEKALNEEIRQGALAQLAEETRDLAEATEDAKEEREDLLDEQKRLQDALARLEKEPGFDKQSRFAENLRDRLTEVTKEIGKQSQDLKEGEATTRRSIVELRKGGKSWEEISEQTGLSVEKAKEYEKQQKLAAEATKRAERASIDLRVQTESAAKKTADLAAQWDKTAGAVSKSVDEMLKATAFLILQARQAESSSGFLETIMYGPGRQLLIDQLKSDLREQVRTMKELDGIIQDLKVEFGLVEVSSKKTSTGITETIVNLTSLYRTALEGTRDLRREVTESEAELAGDLFKAVTVAFNNSEEKLREDFAKANEDLDNQIKEARAKQKKDGGKLEFTLTLEDGSILEGQKAIDAARAQLAEQQKAAEEKNRREREKKELETAETIIENRLAAEERYFSEALAREREALDFRLEFSTEETVAGLEEILAVRTELLEKERDEQIRTVIEGTEAFQDGQEAIKDAFQDRVLEIQRQLRAGSITEAQAIEQRRRAEEEAIRDLAELRTELTTEALDEEGSQAALITERYGKRQKAVYTEIAEKIRLLTLEFDGYEDAITRTTSTLISAWERYFEELDDLRQEDAAKAEETRNEDLALLKKDLLEARITYEDYTSKLRSLRDQDKESEKETQEEKAGFFKGFGQVLAEVSVQQARTAADSLELAENFSNSAEILERSASIAASGVVTAFAGLAVQGGAEIESFGIALLDVVAALLDSVVPALVALIWGEAFAANPLTGGLVAAGITAVLYGLVAAAKAALAGGLGSKMDGGYAGDGRRDEVMGVYHGGEYIHTKEKTQKYRDLFDLIHEGGTPEQWYVGKYGLTKNPGLLVLDRGKSAELLTNADGSTMNNREVIAAVERQTAAVSADLSALRQDVNKLNRDFRHAVHSEVDIHGDIAGSTIRVVANKDAKRKNWQ